MSTITKAIKSPDLDIEVQIACRVVCVKVFFTPRTAITTVFLVDKEGKTIEATSYNPKKSYFVYFNFFVNQTVFLNCYADCIDDKVDKRYSQANYKTDGSPWSLHHCNQDLSPVRFLPEFTDIRKFHKSAQQAKSLVGLFVDMGRGPLKYGADRRIVARGFYIKLRDCNNLTFTALIWSINRTKFRFSLDSWQEGDVVLLPHAREQSEQYRSNSIYAVTTTYPPVVRPQSIDLLRATAALKNASKYPAKNYYPY